MCVGVRVSRVSCVCIVSVCVHTCVCACVVCSSMSFHNANIIMPHDCYNIPTCNVSMEEEWTSEI